MPNAALFVSPFSLADGNGKPYAFSKLNFYVTGTSTPQNTYSDSGLLSGNTNPVVADINGDFGAIYLLANTSYKVVFATSADVLIKSRDPVQGIPINVTPSVGLLQSYLAGCQFSNDGVAPNTKYNVTAGACADDTNTLAMPMSAGSLDCTTTGVNGLDVAGGLGASKTYHAFAIAKVDGTTGLLGSLALSPAMPTGYTLKRRLRSFKTDSFSHVIPDIQIGDEFLLKTPLAALNTTTGSVTTFATGCPTGLSLKVRVNFLGTVGSPGARNILFYSPLQNSQTANTPSGNEQISWGAADQQGAGSVEIWTDTSGQITIDPGASTNLFVTLVGWTDRRGRDA